MLPSHRAAIIASALSALIARPEQGAHRSRDEAHRAVRTDFSAMAVRDVPVRPAPAPCDGASQAGAPSMMPYPHPVGMIRVSANPAAA
jgi:hypothetical protein